MIAVWSTHRDLNAAKRARRAAIAAQTRWDKLMGVPPVPPASEVYRIEQRGQRWAVIIDEPSLAPTQPR